MESGRRLVRALLALAVLASAASAQASSPPRNVDGFTRYVAGRIAKAMPNANVVVGGPLVIKIDKPEAQEIRLDNIWNYCERDKGACSRAVTVFIRDMTGTIRESTAPIEKSNIRAVVRDVHYVDDMIRFTAEKPDAKVIVRPIVGELWLVCVIDSPHGVRLLNRGDIKKLGLSDDEAIALAEQNLAAALPPLASVMRPQIEGIGLVTGDFYDSSRLILHDSWAEESRALHGNLMVAVAATDVLVYGDGANPAKMKMLAGFVAYLAEKAPKPISATLFRWTQSGWETVKP